MGTFLFNTHLNAVQEAEVKCIHVYLPPTWMLSTRLRWMGTCIFTTHLNAVHEAEMNGYLSFHNPPEWVHVYSPPTWTLSTRLRWMGTCLFTTHLNGYMYICHPPECCPRGWDEWIHVYSPRGHSFRYSANHWIGWTPSLTIHTYVRDVHERISILSQIRVSRKKIYEI
jgi:hypothetical protein